MLSCFHVFYSLGQPFVEEFVDLHSQLGELQIHTHTEANLLPEFITKATVLCASVVMMYNYIRDHIFSHLAYVGSILITYGTDNLEIPCTLGKVYYIKSQVSDFYNF